MHYRDLSFEDRAAFCEDRRKMLAQVAPEGFVEELFGKRRDATHADIHAGMDRIFEKYNASVGNFGAKARVLGTKKKEDDNA